MLIPTVPEIPEEDQTPTVKALLLFIDQLSLIAHELSHKTHNQAIEIEKLKNEIAKLKYKDIENGYLHIQKRIRTKKGRLQRILGAISNHFRGPILKKDALKTEYFNQIIYLTVLDSRVIKTIK